MERLGGGGSRDHRAHAWSRPAHPVGELNVRGLILGYPALPEDAPPRRHLSKKRGDLVAQSFLSVHL